MSRPMMWRVAGSVWWSLARARLTSWSSWSPGNWCRLTSVTTKLWVDDGNLRFQIFMLKLTSMG